MDAGVSVAVYIADRLVRRKVIRALRAGGITAIECESAEKDDGRRFDLAVVDVDAPNSESFITKMESLGERLVLVSTAQTDGLSDLLDRHSFGHLVARHAGALRVNQLGPSAMLDEHELRITCEKVLSRDIFGLEKYLGAWGIVFHRASIGSVQAKYDLLDKFEQYLRNLECLPNLVPEMVTIADELVTNAMVHGPRDAEGGEKYAAGPRSAAELAPHEHVDVCYASDGAQLAISVSDNFGMLSRETVFNYLKRSLEARLSPETKTSGAGLGIALSLRFNHRFVFNIHEGHRTEVIAGWDLRAKNGNEFRQADRSLSVFWLPREKT